MPSLYKLRRTKSTPTMRRRGSTPKRRGSTPKRRGSTPTMRRRGSTPTTSFRKKWSKKLRRSKSNGAEPDYNKYNNDVYTFFSHSCIFINNPMTNSTNNELRSGRKLVPKDCILITYGEIGNDNNNSDPLFTEFLDMFKKGHKYFKTPLKYEKELKEIFGSTLHFHYSDYYGKIPRNPKKKFYADIEYDNNMLFNKQSTYNIIINELIENFNWLVGLEKHRSKKRSEIEQLNYDITKETQMGIFFNRISHFNVDDTKIAKFIDTNNISGYIEYLKQSLKPYRLLKTGLYKLYENLIITNKAKYYLTSSQINDMFKKSLIKTKFNFGHPNHNNIPISTLLRVLHPYKVNIKQSELFKTHPGIYYNFTCRSSCDEAVTQPIINLQRLYSAEAAENK